MVATVICMLLSSAPAPGQNRGVTTADPSPGDVRIDVGLTIVTTVMGEPQGDFECIKQVTEASAQLVRYTYTGDRQPDVPNQRLQLQRTQRWDDLKTAHDINTRFSASQPEMVTGATTFSASKEVLQELKTTGTARVGHIVGEGGRDVRYAVTLRRVEPNSIPYETVVNGSARPLPAIHAKSSPEDADQVEFYFLDDLDAPLWLSWESKVRGGKPFGAHVVKLEDGRSVKPQVCQDERVELYGIYFDFNSDAIRSESDPALRGIADALAARPTCRLKIEGHTDNVGGERFNLELSQHRAAAVKSALVERFHIASDRLETAGFGAKRPKSSNATAQGRALNRRVELIRESK